MPYSITGPRCVNFLCCQGTCPSNHRSTCHKFDGSPVTPQPCIPMCPWQDTRRRKLTWPPGLQAPLISQQSLQNAKLQEREITLVANQRNICLPGILSKNKFKIFNGAGIFIDLSFNRLMFWKISPFTNAVESKINQFQCQISWPQFKTVLIFQINPYQFSRICIYQIRAFLIILRNININVRHIISRFRF